MDTNRQIEHTHTHARTYARNNSKSNSNSGRTNANAHAYAHAHACAHGRMHTHARTRTGNKHNTQHMHARTRAHTPCVHYFIIFYCKSVFIFLIYYMHIHWLVVTGFIVSSLVFVNSMPTYKICYPKSANLKRMNATEEICEPVPKPYMSKSQINTIVIYCMWRGVSGGGGGGGCKCDVT